MNKQLWERLSNYVRTKVMSHLDATMLFVEDKTLETDIKQPHQGFYIGITDASGKDIVREGFLRADLTNTKESVDIVIANLVSALKLQNVTISALQTSVFYYTLILSHQYLPDPTAWDETQDGVYFMWGNDYRALYLPYQVQRMMTPTSKEPIALNKVDILDRLCCYEAKVPSSLWRLPEGLIYRLAAESHLA